MTINQYLHDLQPKQILRPTNFKLSDGNTFNNDTPGKGRSFLQKNYENRSNCSKFIDEQTLKCNIHIYTDEWYNLPSF